MKYILDTDICIYWLKGRQSVKEKMLTIDASEIVISVITVAELYFGAYNSSKINQNIAIAEKFIQSLSIIGLSNDSLRKFGEIKADLRQRGTPVADFDLLIASIALTEDLILVSNNTRHYSRINNLKLENWFSQ